MNEIMSTFYWIVIVLYIILSFFGEDGMSKLDDSITTLKGVLIITAFAVGALHLLYLIWS